MLAVSTPGRATIYDTETMNELMSVECFGLMNVLASPDSSKLVLYSQNHRMVWNLNTRRQLYEEFGCARGIAFSVDSEFIVTAVENTAGEKRLCVRRAETGEIVKSIRLSSECHGLRVNPSDGLAYVLDSTGIRAYEIPGLRLRFRIRTPWIAYPTFVVSNNTAAVRIEGNKLQIYDLRTRTLSRTINFGEHTSIERISSDGSAVIIKDGTVYTIIDTRNGDELYGFDTEFHYSEPVFTHDDRIAYIDYDMRVIVYDPETGLRRQISPNDARVASFAFLEYPPDFK
jgi:WD40 repeat protein